MFFEQIESEGIAHYSYIIGDENDSVVIDPKRDVSVYQELAAENNSNISLVLETHRNEDYVIGSMELKDRTDAEVWHADDWLDYEYGKGVSEGNVFEIGELKLEAIHTPGHTPGSMSYLLYDFSDNPWILFTGDVLFADDVGRVDLLGMDKAQEMAEMLYDSIFNKILPLGDEVIVCPAHGSGSVCAGSIGEKSWTTIGMEKKHNPELQVENKGDFVNNVKEKLERPPYFRKMEEVNVSGPPLLRNQDPVNYLNPVDFENISNDAVILDTRGELSFGAAHISESLSIWLEGVPSFAGWFLPYDKPILLVNESGNPSKAITYLRRLGYDNIEGCLSGGLLSWHKSGRTSSSIETVRVQEVCEILDEGADVFILDIRGEEEIKKNGRITEAFEIHLTKLNENLEKIPQEKPVYVFCGSGLRSMTAASLLKKNGFENIKVVLGGLSGWNSTTCPIKK